MKNDVDLLQNNVGIYVRVSTEEQAQEGYSIRGQIEKLRSYCEIMGWGVTQIYADEGISGKNTESRPQLQKMLNDIQNNVINNVLVFKIDRLTRSTKDLINLVEFFNQNNCAFNSLIESIDTTSATGRMFIKIIGIFAEFERENLIERVSLGIDRKFKEGYSIASCTICYGYQRKHGQKIQEIEPNECKIVKRIFNMYLNDDYNMQKIVNTLNLESIPTKKGKKWTIEQVTRVLTNVSYIGKIRHHLNSENYEVVDGKHQAIIDTEIFEKVQKKYNRYKKTLQRHSHSDAFFTGILYYKNKRLFPQYSYSKSIPKKAYVSYSFKIDGKAKQVCSQTKMLKAFELFFDNIENFSENCKIVEENSEQETFFKNEILCAQNNLNKHEIRSKEIVEKYVNQVINFETFQEMSTLINGLIFNLKKHIKDLESELNLLCDPKEKYEVYSNIKENWIDLNEEEKQDFILKFIKRIDLEKTDKNSLPKILKIEFYDFEN